MWFRDPAGLTTGCLLPTGSPGTSCCSKGAPWRPRWWTPVPRWSSCDAAAVGVDRSRESAETHARPGLLAALDGRAARGGGSHGPGGRRGVGGTGRAQARHRRPGTGRRRGRPHRADAVDGRCAPRPRDHRERRADDGRDHPGNPGRRSRVTRQGRPDPAGHPLRRVVTTSACRTVPRRSRSRARPDASPTPCSPSPAAPGQIDGAASDERRHGTPRSRIPPGRAGTGEPKGRPVDHGGFHRRWRLPPLFSPETCSTRRPRPPMVITPGKRSSSSFRWPRAAARTPGHGSSGAS